jgi:crossover junction endodeoxyribonuclease RuvC
MGDLRTILGIDPGSRITGYGVIRSDGIRHYYVASGCVRVLQGNLTQRLQMIYAGLSEIITTYQPDEGAVEQVFIHFHKNINTALKLGLARGAAMVAVANAKLPLAEYSPRQVKKSVVGYGAAEKDQIKKMVQNILKLSTSPPKDAADALAIAICHAHFRGKGIMAEGKFI